MHDRICPDCKTPVPANAPAGVCPKCLLEAGMEIRTAGHVSAAAATIPPNSSGDGADKTTPAADSTVPRIGTTIRYFGDYEVLDEIARGGMGVVYKARQVRLNRKVALKMILAGQFAGEADVQRFQTEAEAAAQLDHPAIVPIFEVGEYDGHHFFSMGLVDGEPLSRRLAREPLSPRDAAETVLRIAEAIAYAHEMGVIHRDLKPANILIDRDGQPRVTDFGLAKRVQGDSHLTASGQVLGTPSYMAPEQAAGRIDEVGVPADVYSLGAILYAALTGRAPFAADNSLDTLMQVMECEPVRPRDLTPSIPKDLETICLKCLEKNRSRRYATAEDLCEELRRFLRGEPILARPIGRLGRSWRWCRRKPALAALVVVLVLMFTVCLPIALIVQSDLIAHRNAAIQEWVRALQQEKAAKDDADKSRELANSQREQAIAAQKREARQRKLAEQRELLARRYLYVYEMQLGKQVWLQNDPARVTELLSRHVPDEGQLDLRGFEWHHLDFLCHSGHIIQTDHSQEVFCVRFSPNGERIVSTGSLDKTLRIRGAESGTTATTIRHEPAIVYEAVFTHDNERVISCGKEKSIRIWNAQTGELVDSLESDIIPIFIDVSKDGSQLVAAGLGGIEVWSLTDKKRTHALTDSARTIAIHPDGHILAYGDSQRVDGQPTHGLRMWRIAEGESEVFLAGFTKPTNDIEFSEDGTTVVAASDDHTAKLWNLESHEVIATFTGHDEPIASVSLSPDGQHLATGSHDRSVRIWSTKTGREVAVLRGHTDLVRTVDFSPDGQSIVSGSRDQTVRVWKVASQGDSTRLGDEDGGAVRQLVFLPNGNVVTGSAKGHVTIWNAQTGKSERQLDGARGVVLSVDVLDGSPTQVVAAGLGNRGIRIWSTEGDDSKSIEVEGRGTRFALSPNGTRAAVVDLRGQVSVVELKSGTQTAMNGRHDGPVYAIAWHPDGKRFATGSYDHSIRVWDPSSGTLVQTLKAHELAVCSLAFSPDGSQLASSSADAIEMDQRRSPSVPGTIRIWDMSKETPTSRAIRGHDGGILDVTFSPDGRTLASAGHDMTVRLWDPITGSQTMQFDGEGQRIWSVAFSPDGSQLAAGLDDGTVRLWRATVGNR